MQGCRGRMTRWGVVYSTEGHPEMGKAMLRLRIMMAAFMLFHSILAKAQGLPNGNDTLFPAPDFLYYPDHGFLHPFYAGDTEYHYEFYDSRDTLIKCAPDFDEVFFISLIRTFPDPEQKYKDAGGVERPLPVTAIVLRYDRTDTDKWICVRYMPNQFYQIKEFGDRFLREDRFDGWEVPAAIKQRKYKFYSTMRY